MAWLISLKGKNVEWIDVINTQKISSLTVITNKNRISVSFNLEDGEKKHLVLKDREQLRTLLMLLPVEDSGFMFAVHDGVIGKWTGSFPDEEEDKNE